MIILKETKEENKNNILILYIKFADLSDITKKIVRSNNRSGNHVVLDIIIRNDLLDNEIEHEVGNDLKGEKFKILSNPEVVRLAVIKSLLQVRCVRKGYVYLYFFHTIGSANINTYYVFVRRL